jgi:cell wall-associated NlpC family hydrolase
MRSRNSTGSDGYADDRFTGVATLDRPETSASAAPRRRQLVDQLPPSPFEQPGYGHGRPFNQQNPLDVPSEYDQPTGLHLLHQPSDLQTPPHGTRTGYAPATGYAAATGYAPAPTTYNRAAAPAAPARPAPAPAPAPFAPAAPAHDTTALLAPVTDAGRARDAVLGVLGAVRGSAVLALAARYLGTPYRYGGTTPRGFDCAGFTRYVFGQFGITLPRTPTLQLQVVEPVARSCARPGDLVFLMAGSRATHVGIYAGGQLMFDAPQAGRAVTKRQIWPRSVVFGRVTG